MQVCKGMNNTYAQNICKIPVERSYVIIKYADDVTCLNEKEYQTL